MGIDRSERRNTRQHRPLGFTVQKSENSQPGAWGGFSGNHQNPQVNQDVGLRKSSLLLPAFSLPAPSAWGEAGRLAHFHFKTPHLDGYGARSFLLASQLAKETSRNFAASAK